MKDIRYANKGMPFEQFVIYSNERYLQRGEAVIDKVPTEFIPIRDSRGKVISCKVNKKSSVDFLGRVGSRPIAIEAKHTSSDSIRWDAVQPHQAAYLERYIDRGQGIGVVLVSFNLRRFWAVPAQFWLAARSAWENSPKSKPTVEHEGTIWTGNGKASVKQSELLPEWEVTMDARIGLDYLRRYI